MDTATNGLANVFLRDVTAGTTTRISFTLDGSDPNGNSGKDFIAISPSGLFVLYSSTATNIDLFDSTSQSKIFVRDPFLQNTQIVSAPSPSERADSDSYKASWSGDESWIAFDSSASNLVDKDTNFSLDVFLSLFHWVPVAKFLVEDRAHTDHWHPMARTFDATQSYEPYGSIVSYDWDFGDRYKRDKSKNQQRDQYSTCSCGHTSRWILKRSLVLKILSA